MENKKLNGFNNGRDTTDGVGGKSFEELNGKLTFLTDGQEQTVKNILKSLSNIDEDISLNAKIWSENSAVQISSHIQNLKKLIRESAIVPSENQESIK